MEGSRRGPSFVACQLHLPRIALRRAAHASPRGRAASPTSAGGLASFALTWSVIAFNGPMGTAATSTTTASTQSSSSSTTQATATATPETSSSDNSSTDDSSASDAAPVTTSQS